MSDQTTDETYVVMVTITRPLLAAEPVRMRWGCQYPPTHQGGRFNPLGGEVEVNADSLRDMMEDVDAIAAGYQQRHMHRAFKQVG